MEETLRIDRIPISIHSLHRARHEFLPHLGNHPNNRTSEDLNTETPISYRSSNGGNFENSSEEKHQGLFAASKTSECHYISGDSLPSQHVLPINSDAYTREHQISDLSWFEDSPEPMMTVNDYFDRTPSLSTCLLPPHLRMSSNETQCTYVSRTFTCFPRLPSELRVKIWKFAALLPRAVALHHREYDLTPASPNPARLCIVEQKVNIAAAILQVNQESRTEVKQYFYCAFGLSVMHRVNEVLPDDWLSDLSNIRPFSLTSHPIVHISIHSDVLYCSKDVVDHFAKFEGEYYMPPPFKNVATIALDIHCISTQQSLFVEWILDYDYIEEIIFVARLETDNQAALPARGTLEFVDLKKHEIRVYYERYLAGILDELWETNSERYIEASIWNEAFGINDSDDEPQSSDEDAEKLANEEEGLVQDYFHPALFGDFIPKIRIMGLLSNGIRI